jgi:hypothetical protein
MPIILLLLLAGSTPRAVTACGDAAPTGFYVGTVHSTQSGTLDVTLNLRCSGAEFAGALVTPVGTFVVDSGGYSANHLVLWFDAGTDHGRISGAIVGDSLIARFTVPDDSGQVTLRRVAGPRTADVPTPNVFVTAAQWHEDVDTFARAVARGHANAFAHYPQRAFDGDVAVLDSALGQLNPDQVYVRLDAIANRIGDGHTFVAMPGDDPYLPFVFRRFGGSYRVAAAATEYARAIGARLIGVGGVTAEAARQALLTLTPATEGMSLRDSRAEDFLTMGMMLHGLGIIPDRSQTRYRFVNDSGATFDIVARAMPMTAADSVRWRYAFPDPPLSRQRPGESFWFTYIPKDRVVYCNWRGYDGLEQHAAALLALVDSVRPERVLIDMRQNGGGDYTLGQRYVIEPIALRSWLNRPDRLFVAIGANTFSAGMSNAAQFHTQTRATLVGTPIGERPNSYQEAREVHLPNTWLTVRYSTKYYRFAPSGPNEVRPDLLIRTTWTDYRSGRDPVLDYVLKARHR